MKPLINVEDITEFKGHEHGVFKQQVLFVIPEIHNELSGIHIAGYTLVRQSTNKKTPRIWGLMLKYVYYFSRTIFLFRIAPFCSIL